MHVGGGGMVVTNGVRSSINKLKTNVGISMQNECQIEVDFYRTRTLWNLLLAFTD